MIVTIGLSIALQYTYQFFFGGEPLRIVDRNPESHPTSVACSLTQQSLVSVIIAVVVLGGVAYFLRRHADRAGDPRRVGQPGPGRGVRHLRGPDHPARLDARRRAAPAWAASCIGLYLGATALEHRAARCCSSCSPP